MKKKLFSIILAVCLAGALSSTAFAANTPITEEQAKKAAQDSVPADSILLKSKLDDGKYEINFYNSAKQEEYEIKILAATGKIVSYESELDSHRGGLKTTLTQAEAEKAVTDEISGAKIISSSLETDDGFQKYKIRFQTENTYGKYTIHPESGIILERDIHIGTAPASVDPSALLTREKVLELAEKEVPGGTIVDFDLDWDGGTPVYEVETYLNGTEYDLYFDAKTGTLLWSESDAEKQAYRQSIQNSNANEYIGIDKAKEIALARVPGAAVLKCELDYDDGYAVYEGELYLNGWEYEFEIDARTGTVLEWDQDN